MVKTFNSAQILVTWGNLNLTSGALSEGTFLEASPTARRASQTGLMGGGAVVSIMNNTTGTVTVTLATAADVNDALTDALQQQIDTGKPTVGPLLVKDHSGRSVLSCEKALLDGFVPMSYAGDGTPTNQWIFLCPNLKFETRGSNDAT
jgi:hypothetical protein